MITAVRVREALNYDPATGVLTWRATKRCDRIGCVAGCTDGKGYLCVKLGGTLYRAHRLAWLHFYGAHPVNQIDHINGARGDNRITNLRDVTCSENLQNQRAARSNNALGVLGVRFHKGRYMASITVRGYNKHLGCFDTVAQAQAAYASAKRELHPITTTKKD